MSELGAPQSRAALTAVGAVAGTVLVLLLAVWAASIGPDGVFSGPGPVPVETSRTPSPAVPTANELPEPPAQEAAESDEFSTPSAWLKVIALLSQITTGLIAMYAAFRALIWLRRRLSQRQRREAPPPEMDIEILEEQVLDEVVEAIVSGASGQREVLLVGEPRNAIVACWHRLEVGADRAGVRRESWETSAEFTLRMLDRVSADPEALAELAGLYREARFSEHVLEEEARARAIGALDRIHAGLSARPGAGRRR